MSFKEWFRRRMSQPPDPHPAFLDRLLELEKRLDKLGEGKGCVSPVVIQHADKVIVERVMYSNHFGTLDIDSLEGQLNIGLNCRGEVELPEGLLPASKKKPAPSKAAAPKGAEGPVCNIRPHAR